MTTAPTGPPAVATDPAATVLVSPTVRRAARAVLLLATAEVIGKLATFVIFVSAARKLSGHGFGEFAFDIALSLLIGTLVGWGYESVTTRRGSRDRASLDDGYADLVALLTGVSGAALGVLVIVLAVTGDLGTDGVALVLLTGGTLLDNVTDAGRAVASAIGEQSATAFVLTGQRMVTMVVGVGSLLLGGGLVGVAAGFLAGSLLGTLSMLAVVRRLGIPLNWRRARTSRMRTLFVEAVPLGVNGVVSDALFRLDSVLLGLLIGSIAVGRYAAAYKLLETVLFINWSVARAVYPAMSAAREPGTVRLAVERGIGICGFAFFPYAALLLLRGGDLLHLLYGSAYAGRAAVVLAWLAPAPLAFGIAYLCAYALFAIDRPRAVLVASIGALVINVTANLALIPLLSDIGTAITTTGCYVVEAVVMAALLGPSCGRIRLERSLAIPAGAVLPSLAVLLVPLPVVAAGATELAVYLAAWALLSRRFDPQGLAVLTSLMPRRGRR